MKSDQGKNHGIAAINSVVFYSLQSGFSTLKCRQNMLFACPPFCPLEVVVVLEMTSDSPIIPFASDECLRWLSTKMKIETLKFLHSQSHLVRVCSDKSVVGHSYFRSFKKKIVDFGRWIINNLRSIQLNFKIILVRPLCNISVWTAKGDFSTDFFTYILISRIVSLQLR